RSSWNASSTRRERSTVVTWTSVGRAISAVRRAERSPQAVVEPVLERREAGETPPEEERPVARADRNPRKPRGRHRRGNVLRAVGSDTDPEMRADDVLVRDDARRIGERLHLRPDPTLDRRAGGRALPRHLGAGERVEAPMRPGVRPDRDEARRVELCDLVPGQRERRRPALARSGTDRRGIASLDESGREEHGRRQPEVAEHRPCLRGDLAVAVVERDRDEVALEREAETPDAVDEGNDLAMPREVAHLFREHVAREVHLPLHARADAVIAEDQQPRLPGAGKRRRCEETELDRTLPEGDRRETDTGARAHGAAGTPSAATVSDPGRGVGRSSGRRLPGIFTMHGSMNRNGSTCVRSRASSPKLASADRITEIERNEPTARITMPFVRHRRRPAWIARRFTK